MQHRLIAALLALAVLFSFGACAPADTPAAAAGEGELTVTYFDVGQADAILISLPDGRFIQIDGGNDGDGDALVPALRERGVKTLNFVVGTHPHADHIGGLDELVEAFDVGKVYLPRTAASDTPDTRTYENLLETVRDKGLKISQAKAGTVLLDEPGLRLACVAPAADGYDDLNDYSAVLRLTYGEHSFLFTGDAGEASEGEMLQSGQDLRADVLKVGHHGSDTASTEAFLRAVKPEFAVISCGEGNSYGHPHAQAVARLQATGAQILRTDLCGTVTARSDGKRLTMETAAGERHTASAQSAATAASNGGAASSAAEAGLSADAAQQSSSAQEKVYRTPSGARYHRAGCSALGDSAEALTIAEAKEAGLTPCQRCHPPE